MRCHAGQCTDPDSLSPEDAVDDGGMPAHPQCATYADEPTDAGRSWTCAGCTVTVQDDPEHGVVTWEDRVYCSVECSVRHERRLTAAASRQT